MKYTENWNLILPKKQGNEKLIQVYNPKYAEIINFLNNKLIKNVHFNPKTVQKFKNTK